ncbi:MAG: AAA family ATPase [Prevotella sp.]|nr:AAA family ATPase [Prevotella sp.]
MTSKKKYPIGIQEFESLRKDGYYYVDKTPIIYSMITEGKRGIYVLGFPNNEVRKGFADCLSKRIAKEK